jgi:circadian clock protein KaiC
MTKTDDDVDLITTGVAGLDSILHGGLVRGGLYLLEGTPGSGKTTLALQFLLAGVRRGERCVYVTLSESERELHAAARSHGWSLEGIEILEINASNGEVEPDRRYTMFHPSEVELSGTAQTVIDVVERVKASMLVFDSLAELRLLAENALRYRRQVLALKVYFARSGVTVFFIEDRTGDTRDMHLHSIAGGVMSMEREAPEYGPMRRRLQITKLRTRSFDEGFHDFVIRRGGVEIYPRIVAREHSFEYERGVVLSGLAELDRLLGGGLAKGTSTLLAGPAGSGKSSLATQYAFTAAKQGGHACMFLFDEARATLLERSTGLGMALEPLVDAGRLSLQQVDPAELSAGEFGQLVRGLVRPGETSIVVIDSLNGYLNAMPSERFLTLQLHELLMYLGQQGVSTLLLLAQQGMMGPMSSPIDASYLADTVILLRYFEAFGAVRQAISVVKKRTGKHERTIRELKMDNGITVGPPLKEFQGVLTGVPDYIGTAADTSAGIRAQ